MTKECGHKVVFGYLDGVVWDEKWVGEGTESVQRVFEERSLRGKGG